MCLMNSALEISIGGGGGEGGFHAENSHTQCFLEDLVFLGGLSLIGRGVARAVYLSPLPLKGPPRNPGT